MGGSLLSFNSCAAALLAAVPNSHQRVHRSLAKCSSLLFTFLLARGVS